MEVQGGDLCSEPLRRCESLETIGEKAGCCGQEKLVKPIDYGPCAEISPALVERIARRVGREPHPWFTRGVFSTHRGLDVLLDAVDAGHSFYILVKQHALRDSLHLGHLLPLHMAAYLQSAFGAPVVVQLADDWAFSTQTKTLHETGIASKKTARDVLAAGLDPARTFLFGSIAHAGAMYPVMVRVQKHVSMCHVQEALSLQFGDNMAQHASVSARIAAHFARSFCGVLSQEENVRCLAVGASHDDPLFCLALCAADALQWQRPAALYCRPLCALQSVRVRMGVTLVDAEVLFPRLDRADKQQGDGRIRADDRACLVDSAPTDGAGAVEIEKKKQMVTIDSAIWLSGTNKAIERKVRNQAFSGGKATIEEHRRQGGDCTVDVAYQYIEAFCPDDAALATVGSDYSEGRMLTGQLKSALVQILVPLISHYQKAHDALDDSAFDACFVARPLA